MSADSVDAVDVAVAGSRMYTLAPHFLATSAMASSSVETYLRHAREGRLWVPPLGASGLGPSPFSAAPPLASRRRE
eukprot:2814280-Prymnesium_polylepis.2